MNPKSIARLIGLSLLLPYGLFAQSSFWLNNYYVGVDAPVFDSQGVSLAGADYRAELWGGATSNALAPALSYYSQIRVMTPFLTAEHAGYFRDMDIRLGSGDHTAIMTVPPRGWAWLQVRAWDTRLGSTYEDVVALGLGGYGESPLFYAQGADPTPIVPDVPAPLIGLQSFSLRAVVPEPSTWALLALGGVGLWLASRRWSQRCL